MKNSSGARKNPNATEPEFLTISIALDRDKKKKFPFEFSWFQFYRSSFGSSSRKIVNLLEKFDFRSNVITVVLKVY